MSRDELKKAVKARLDEISPFDEPDEFIEGVDDEDFKRVKPIDSYIETELDNAARFCLNTLPLTLLADDTDTETMRISVDDKGVGVIKDMYDYLRLVRLSCSVFERDITQFISSSSEIYILQQNKHTRGGVVKPVAAFCPENACIEVYSFPTGVKSSTCKLSYIDTRLRAERVQSHVEKYIVLRCAMVVARILDDKTASQILEKEWAEELSNILK